MGAAATRVLIVEDDPVIRARFERAIDAHPRLRLAGSAGSLEEGGRMVADADADVLLVDLGLPDGSGIELIRRARARSPAMECMVITIYDDERHVMEALEAGATGYVLKDAMKEDVADAVLTLVGGGSPISPRIARALLGRIPRAAAAPASVEGLTRREVEVLEYLAMGYGRQEIADKLSVSVHTIHSHVKHIYGKLAAHSSTEAVFLARRKGLIR